MDSAQGLPAVGETLHGFEIEVTRERVRAYADAASDYNPIHLDAGFAATTALGGTVAHGMLLLAYLARLMTQRFGAAWLRGGTLNARFRAPARVGARVRAGGMICSVAVGVDAVVVACDLQVTGAAGDALVTATAQVTLPRPR